MYDKFFFLKNINIYTIIYICYANLLFQYFIVLYDAFSKHRCHDRWNFYPGNYDNS